MRIKREGRVVFHDGKLAIWEEGLGGCRTFNERAAWGRQFKRDVFKRIIQTLNRLGWTVGPGNYIRTGNNTRYCVKGDLKADLSISGRCVDLEFFQSVNCPTRPDHEGRYEFHKEAVMPYPVRLEMERTRTRIKDYLCNVFEGYTFEDKAPRHTPETADEYLQRQYAESWHFKGDISNYEISNGNRRSADGKALEHGQRVWFYDRKGRLNMGVAHYNINNMWWVATRRHSVTNKASFELFATCPENPRQKRNGELRRQRLEEEQAKAIKVMDFERAAVLRDIIWPKPEPLYMVWHTGHSLYHRPRWRGYTADATSAGRFTRAELDAWIGRGETQRGENKAIACSVQGALL